jgi:hypothetical protein
VSALLYDILLYLTLYFIFTNRMREETLKSLIYLVDKLQENMLQERLVKCVVNLQGDGEASIRTNAIIFLSRISPKLKEAVRYVFVLINS